MSRPYPYTDPQGRVWIREYGCALCQCYHVQGIDPLYDLHLHRQAKHHEPRDRVARAGEIFALELARESL